MDEQDLTRIYAIYQNKFFIFAKNKEYEYSCGTIKKENHKLEGGHFQGFIRHGNTTRDQPEELHRNNP